MKILIKNGHLLDPIAKRDGNFDILISDGKIEKVASKIDCENSKVIDATGKYVMPGFIDLHVHFREPGYEYKETIKTGSMAAAKGGFTSVCPMPNTNPVIDNPMMVEYLKLKSEKEAVVNILPVGTVTKGQQGKEIADIKGMVKKGILAISEDGKSVMDTLVYMEGMKIAAKEKIVVLAHCEDKPLVRGGVMNDGKRANELGLLGITNTVEDVITARDIFMAKEANVKLHLCHCSTKDSVNLIKMAKANGQAVTGEVCPHHFTIADEEIPNDDANYKMNPPLRSMEDIKALKEGLRDNIMDVISTDHAPHSEEEKKQSMKTAPFGIVGLETAFALTVTELVKQGFLTKMQLVEKMSVNPAKIIGIDRGTLLEGKVADLVIADFDKEYIIDKNTFVSKGKNTPFDGKKVFGDILLTMVNGDIVYVYPNKFLKM